MSDMYHRTAERLSAYNPEFDPAVVNHISEVAERQSRFETYDDLFDAAQMPHIKPFVSPYDQNHALEIVDIRPKEHDPARAITVHLPMANALDPNQRYQLATIAMALPTERIIAFGNPSGGKYDSGRLKHADRKTLLAKPASLEPLIRMSDYYLGKQGIEQTDEFGESYGALKAVAATLYGEHAVKRLVAIEPLLGHRNVLKMGLDFKKTNKAWQGYSDAAGLLTFNHARNDSLSMASYTRGLLLLSNLAIARTLARGHFEQLLPTAIENNDDMQVHLSWGSESEFGTDIPLLSLSAWLKNVHKNRVHTTRLIGQKHALPNDIHLKAALVYQAVTTN